MTIRIGNIEFVNLPVILAPLEDITDPPFRSICKELGADLMYTEFIASEGLIRDAGKSTRKLEFSEEERPIGIQIFGHDIDSMIKATKIAEEANPDLIDINFGCPVRKVVAKGSGAAMLKDPEKMIRMTEAVVRTTSLPVTVKTRLGWDEKSKIITEIVEPLQDTGIVALSIHGRTRVQLYGGKADWTLIGEVKNNPRIDIPIFGNGDVTSPEIALKMKQKYDVDGIMIGRAAIGNPWIFNRTKHYLETGELLPLPGIKERLHFCKAHLERSIAWKGEHRGVIEMRKFYSNYFKGYQNFKPFKMRLMETTDIEGIWKILEDIERYY